MKAKMPWLRRRLRELQRTPAALARELKVAPPRVYEMIGGRRGMQPNEIEPTARFLDWTVEELMARLPKTARVLPLHRAAFISHAPNEAGMSAVMQVLDSIQNQSCDAMLTGETSVRPGTSVLGREDIRCLYIQTKLMEPWRAPGEVVVFELKRPPRDNDHVVIFMTGTKDAQPVIVRQLLNQSGSKLCVRQHNPSKLTHLDKAKIASMYRVVTWDDVVR